MNIQPMRALDRESVQRAGALLRYHHAGNERAWVATLQGDTREGGPYGTLCALAALNERLIQLIADWTETDYNTILDNNERAIAQALPRTNTEGTTQ